MLMTSALLEHLMDMGDGTKLLTVAVYALFVTLLVYLWTRKDPLGDSSDESLDLLISDTATSDSDSIESVRQFTVLEAIQKPELYCLFVSFLIGGGSSLVLINNLGQLVPSLGGQKDDQDVFVSLIRYGSYCSQGTDQCVSVSNCAGRLIAGAIGDALLRSKGIPRPFVFGGALACCGAGLACLTVGTMTAIYPAALLVGLGYGAQNSLCPTLVSEIFGLKHFAAIYATNSLSIAVSSYSLATKLASELYDQHLKDGETECHGPQCFRLTFAICSMACAACMLVTWLLARLSQRRYRTLYPQFYKGHTAIQSS